MTGGAVVRFAPAIVLLAGVALLTSASRPTFSPHEKVYYADAQLVDFVRAGLIVKIFSADIASDGTIRARFRVTDQNGLPLDRLGVNTPGTVSTSFIVSTIPTGQTQYVSYTTRVQASPITGVSTNQAGTDANGVYAQNADGEYTYTFGTKTPASINRSATHTVGMYSSRNLTVFGMGTQYSDSVFHFVPDGSAVKVTRDVVRTASCSALRKSSGLNIESSELALGLVPYLDDFEARFLDLRFGKSSSHQVLADS